MFSIDQFTVFVAIVDEGSFTAAAHRLGRAPSAITYAVQKLEEQSDIPLFDRSAYRPVLTEAGRSLLPRARRILAGLSQYRAQARALAAGLEAKISLAIPDSMPRRLLTDALGTFMTGFPSVRLRITNEAQAMALHRLANDTAQIAILLDYPDLPSWFDRWHCGFVELVAVAAPSHPLAAAKGPLSSEVLHDYLQIVVVQRELPDLSPDRGIVAINRWDVADLARKQTLLLAGIGWGSMPIDLVANDLESGRLVKLEPQSWEGARQMPSISIVIGHHHDRAQGPAAQALIQSFLNVATNAETTRTV